MPVDVGNDIFSGIPAAYQWLSDATITGPFLSLFTPSATDPFISYTGANVITILVLTSIYLLLFSLSISIIATISTRIYLMISDHTGKDNAETIRTPLATVVMLAGIFFLKNLFF
ncbi:MAG: hypothetical protein JXA07_05655 [Spirochaetes bacterium]|nr:hypothetical protein [Spirochaetota bacterium]